MDFDRDGRLDLVVARYAKFDIQRAAPPGSYPTCQWKGIAVFCGPRGLPSDTNVLYRNTGGGYFQDVTSAARIDRTSGRYCFSVSALDFDNDGWPDIYVACDSRLHFGLGPNTKIDYVEAHWPSGLVERFASPAIDRILVMKEGLGEAVSQSPRQGTPKH
ncbi:MAG TPA: CRTAC1 family protein [Terriglobia bacterium]|nr:CRTAC1 family protein [Terriglobia bacterium]